MDRPPTIPILLTITTIVASVVSSSSLLQSESIYDALRSHGLPTGLFPKGITNFTVDPESGRFQVRLNESCNAKFETDVHYDWNISGTLRLGEIGDMSGVAAQDLFLWFPVKGIRVDFPSSGLVSFDVGVVRKQFSLSLFETPPDCTASDDPVELVPTDDLLHMSTNRLIAQKRVERMKDHGTILRSVS